MQEYEEHKNLGRMPIEMEHNQRCEENQKSHVDYKTHNPKKPTGTIKLKQSKQSLKKISCSRGNILRPGSINPVYILVFYFI